MIPKPVLEFAVTQNLKKYKDIEMILLKGHLILEQMLYQLIAVHQIDIVRVEKMNLMFGKSVELLCALNSGILGEDEQHLKAINRIRNKVAHEIFFDAYHADLKDWASQVLGYTPKTIDRPSTYRNHVIKAFSCLAGKLQGMSEGLEAVQRLQRQ